MEKYQKKNIGGYFLLITDLMRVMALGLDCSMTFGVVIEAPRKLSQWCIAMCTTNLMADLVSYPVAPLSGILAFLKWLRTRRLMPSREFFNLLTYESMLWRYR